MKLTRFGKITEVDGHIQFEDFHLDCEGDVVTDATAALTQAIIERLRSELLATGTATNVTLE